MKIVKIMFSVVAVCCLLLLTPHQSHAATLPADDISHQQIETAQFFKLIAIIMPFQCEASRIQVPVSPAASPLEVRVVGKSGKALYSESTSGTDVTIPANIKQEDVKHIEVSQLGKVIAIIYPAHDSENHRAISIVIIDPT